MRITENFSQAYFTKCYQHVGEDDRLDIFCFYLREIQKRQGNARTILDIGCAYGDFLSLCDMAKLQTFGNEVSPHAVKEARKRTKAQISLFDAAKDQWPYQDEFFDVVTVFDVVEHVKPAGQLLQEAYRVLHTNGLLFLTTPNNQGWFGKVGEKWFPDDPTHINKQNASFWRKSLVKSGFSRIECRGVILHGFPPLPSVRRIARSSHLPVMVRPIFFPFLALCGTLFFWARK